MTKAKYIGCSHDGWQHTELHYEYRGHNYIVTKHNNGYMGESLAKQHKQAQHDIDEAIANENKPHEELQYAGSAQEGLDLFWAFVEDTVNIEEISKLR